MCLFFVFFFFSSRRRHTKVALVTGVQTCALPIFSPGTGAEFSILPPENATGNFTKIVQRITVRIAIIASPKVRRLLVPGMSVVAVVDTRNAAGELKEISSTDK